MSIWNAIFLGVIQGLTEFLPVSSSGHLVFFQNILGFHEPMIAFDIAVHFGTLLSVFIYFWKDLRGMLFDGIVFLKTLFKAKDREAFYREHPYVLVMGLIIITTGVTGVLGYVFHEILRELFKSLFAVGIAWLVMGVILILSHRFQRGDKPLGSMNQQDAFVIGFAQGVAIIPGISRSGSTILAGMLCGIRKEDAARYSFLAGICAIIAAGIFEWKESVEFFEANSLAMGVGFLTSAVVGYFAIHALMKIVQKGRFYVFGFYCSLMGILALGYHFLLLNGLS